MGKIKEAIKESKILALLSGTPYQAFFLNCSDLDVLKLPKHHPGLEKPRETSVCPLLGGEENLPSPG